MTTFAGAPAPVGAQLESEADPISEALGDIRWGMTQEELLAHFARRIRGSYEERIANARDAMHEDRLHREMNQKIRRIRDSYVAFQGQTTGLDVSFLRWEFTHNNQESMISVSDRNAQNYYFFVQGRLWKWYRAFHANVFGGHSFQQFAGAIQRRFGAAEERTHTARESVRPNRWLGWQNARTRLRAVDENQFYGFYCLVFEDRETLNNLDHLRTAPEQRGRTRSSRLVESVTRENDEAPSTANADIVDRITGRTRRPATGNPG
ncbi:MAG: hypothetical protein AAF355_13420 [Myxococcota bacterium]